MLSEKEVIAYFIFFIFLFFSNMLNHMKVAKNLIEYLEDCKDEIEEVDKAWYQQALKFLDDYQTEIQEELEWEYSERYTPTESKFVF